MQRFKVIKWQGGREKPIVFRANNHTEQGTRFIFWDEQNTFVDEFEKNEIRGITNLETGEIIFPKPRN